MALAVNRGAADARDPNPTPEDTHAQPEAGFAPGSSVAGAAAANAKLAKDCGPPDPHAQRAADPAGAAAKMLPPLPNGVFAASGFSVACGLWACGAARAGMSDARSVEPFGRSTLTNFRLASSSGGAGLHLPPSVSSSSSSSFSALNFVSCFSGGRFMANAARGQLAAAAVPGGPNVQPSDWLARCE